MKDETIYTTTGYDESLTGTADSIIEYVEHETGMIVKRNGDTIWVAEGQKQTIYIIKLIETIILGEIS